MTEILDATLESGAAYIAFAIVVCVGYALLLVGILFAALIALHCWRWLTVHTWGHLIVSLQRKALR
jgi:hypothetical protein